MRKISLRPCLTFWCSFIWIELRGAIDGEKSQNGKSKTPSTAPSTLVPNKIAIWSAASAF
tara:strand:+ start:428 stop:607 length:180 start_codon:yes stop_codon:yes gene_type:complete